MKIVWIHQKIEILPVYHVSCMAVSHSFNQLAKDVFRRFFSNSNFSPGFSIDVLKQIPLWRELHN